MLFSTLFSRRLISSYLVAGALLFSAFTPAVQAADSCGCWCGNAGVGAQLLKGGEQQDSPAACATACRAAGQRLVGCFTSDANTPPKDDKCWDEQACIDQGAGYEYVGKQFDCPSNMGYCYAPTKLTVRLNASLGGVSEVGTIAEYTALIYRILIGVGALLSVLMVIIAGFQWMTSRGNQSQITKAKERIEAVVVGLVLLLSAYVIARVIDPRLVKINPLRVPQLKSIELLSGATSCEKLEDYGYEVEEIEGGRECGKTGQVTKTEGVAADVQSNIEIGASCRFTGCTDQSDVCIAESGGSARCTSCEDATADMGYTETAVDLGGRIAPLCSAIENQLRSRETNPDRYYACVYETNQVFNGCVEISNTNNYIDCEALRTQAAGMGIEACSLYSQLVEPNDREGTDKVGGVLNSLCDKDICGLAAAAGISSCSSSIVEFETSNYAVCNGN